MGEEITIETEKEFNANGGSVLGIYDLLFLIWFKTSSGLFNIKELSALSVSLRHSATAYVTLCSLLCLMWFYNKLWEVQ